MKCECKELDDYMLNSIKNCCKIDEYLDIKYCLCEKYLLEILVLVCEDEMVNTTKTSLNDKKATCKKIIALFTRFHW